MQWWNDFETWVASYNGWRVISTAVVPFVAIIIAGLLAAMIARGSAKRVLAYHDREAKSAAVMALIGVGRRATVWSSLGGDEKQRVDNQLSEADIRVRLLPVNGTNAAADWAAHELAGMKKNSASFSFQADQTFVEFRNRLLEWQAKPKRARKLFAFDLEQWRYDDDAVDKTLLEKQQKWSATQAAEKAMQDEKSRDTEARDSVRPAFVVPAIAAPTPDGAAGSTTMQSATPGRSTTSDHTSDHASADYDGESDSSTAPIVTSADNQSSDSAAADHESSGHTPDAEGAYAPPVTAGAVRRRTDPEQPLD